MNTIGKLNKDVFEPLFGKLTTDEIIVTNERLEHIYAHHPEDYELFINHIQELIINPNYILEDCKNDNTILIIKKVENTNLNVVVKLAIETIDPDRKNSVMTFYRIRDKNLNKLIKKNQIICKIE